jgi:hypothetical protein
MKEKLSTKESLSQKSLEDAMVEIEKMRLDSGKLMDVESSKFVWTLDINKLKEFSDKAKGIKS